MPDKKLLIWDFDGTLAFRIGGWSGALASLLRRDPAYPGVSADDIRPFLGSGFPWNAPENLHPGLSQADWWEELLPLFIRAFRGIGVEPKMAARLSGSVRAEYLDLSAWQIYPDSLAALTIFQVHGWDQVLLTNHVPELSIILDHLGLGSFFAAVFNSAQTGVEKPNPKAFRLVKDWAGPDFHAWMIGDNFTADILGAHEAGIPAILVRKTHPQAPFACLSLEGLKEYLQPGANP